MKFKKIPGGMMAQRVDSSPAGTTENVAVANGGQESNVDAGTPNGGQDSNGETCTPNGGQTVPSTEVVPSGNAVVELGSTNDGIVGPVLGSRGPGQNGGRGSNVQVQSEQSIPFNSSVWQGRGNGRGNHPFHNGQQRGKNRAERNSNRGRGRGAPFQTKEYYSSAFASFTSSAVGYIDATSGNSTSFSGGDRFSHALIANGKHHAHRKQLTFQDAGFTVGIMDMSMVILGIRLFRDNAEPHFTVQLCSLPWLEFMHFKSRQ
jgi:hypothetical protein